MDFIDILEFSINISFPFSNSGNTYKRVMLYVEHANKIFQWLKWSCLQIIYERYSCCSTEKVKQQDILYLNFCEEPSMI